MSEVSEFEYAGTVSHGTMRTVDLVPAFLGVLRELSIVRYNKIETSWRRRLQQIDDHKRRCRDTVDIPWEEDDDLLMDELLQALSECAPEGYYFGTIEGDGSDYGFWRARGEPWVVGVTETCEVLGTFDTEDEAVEFIDTLPNHEDGIYYLDSPTKQETQISDRRVRVVLGLHSLGAGLRWLSEKVFDAADSIESRA